MPLVPQGERLGAPVAGTRQFIAIGLNYRKHAQEAGLELPKEPVVFTKTVSCAVGANDAVAWPLGIGGKGNDGVSGYVKQTPGAIGYVELSYAITNKLNYAAVRNRAGNFIVPSKESIKAAAASIA